MGEYQNNDNVLSCKRCLKDMKVGGPQFFLHNQSQEQCLLESGGQQKSEQIFVVQFKCCKNKESYKPT